MSTVTRTTEEFSSRRRINYGSGSNATPSLTSSSAVLSPHKHYYTKDKDGIEAYLIKFNIGDFNFDEISIRTEGYRLIVQGRSKINTPEAKDFSREFTRDFTLPQDVDPFSIKAQLDEKTRDLTLTSQLVDMPIVQKLINSRLDSSCGMISKKNIATGFEYELFVGPELRDGEVSLEITKNKDATLLSISISKTTTDNYGDSKLEMKRTIKVDNDVDIKNIEKEMNSKTATLQVKIPQK